MVLRLAEGWKRVEPIGNWQLPGEPAFARSRAFDLLLRDLRRYVMEEVPGRSFLIAGHRGAGKTATVTEAIRRLHNEMLQASTNSDKPPIGRRSRLQRPLMVKLVGQSLLEPPPLQHRKGQEAQEAEGAGEAGDADAANEEKQGAPANSGGASVPPEQDDVGSALVHLTIALYRALSAEVAAAFAVHAREGNEETFAERLELAAQLALELDGAPSTGLLRAYWERLGRLRSGVLWPPRSDLALKNSSIVDQGMRELIALATAAQAFQVCSGDTVYKLTGLENARREGTLSSSADLKDLVNRLGALGAGVLAGSVVGIDAGAVPGVGTGLLVWLVSGATLTWAGTRFRKSEQTVDYTFLRDSSIQTLDRDLPLVIDRIRHAGLAPVFVIDELDKLKHPSQTIAKLIGRLKHLVSDYGFFCFLTDRDYFDEVEQTIANQPYPTEHTYFSHRVLVLNRPKDLFVYLKSVVVPEPSLPDGQDFPLAAFALLVMYRSKLNFADVAREIARMIDTGLELAPTETLAPDQVPLCREDELMLPGPYRLAATIQLAINEVLAGDQVAKRFETDPAFAQLAIDALYYIPRCWEKNFLKEVELSEKAIKTDLLSRMRETPPDEPSAGEGPDASADPPPIEAERDGDEPNPDSGEEQPSAAAGDGAASDPPEPPISQPDLQLLHLMVNQMAHYLTDFRRLQAALRERVTEPSWLAEIVIYEKERLLAPVDPDDTRFRFTLDDLATPLPDPEPVAEAVHPSPPLEDRADLPEAISNLLRATGMTIDTLVQNRLLPSNLSDTLLETTTRQIAAAAADPSNVEAVRRAEDGHLAFAKAFDDYGPRLSEGLGLVRYFQGTKPNDARPGLLRRIARYFDRGSGPVLPVDWEPRTGSPPMSGTADSIQTFTSNFASPPEAGPEPPLEKIADAVRWQRWREQIPNILNGGPSAITPTFLDMRLAAEDQVPGSLFRGDLAEMGLLDWSNAALAALPGAKKDAEGPFWLLFAALRALGFDENRLARLAKSPPPKRARLASGDEELIKQLVARGVTRQPGLLYLYPSGREPAVGMEVPRTRPLLAVAVGAIEHHVTGLDWLAENEALEGIIHAID